MPERRPLTRREAEVGALVLIGIGAPADSLQSTRTRVREIDPKAGDTGGGEVRSCLDAPDWIEVLGSSAASVRINVRARRWVVHRDGASNPANVAVIERAIEQAMNRG